MLFYNKTLLKAAGITMPAHPTWTEVAADAAKLNKPGARSGDLPARPGRLGRQHGRRWTR